MQIVIELLLQKVVLLVRNTSFIKNLLFQNADIQHIKQSSHVITQLNKHSFLFIAMNRKKKTCIGH